VDHSPAQQDTPPRELSALYVTTVPITLEVFLAPFAAHFRALGWRVDALANGAPQSTNLDGVFDERLDIGWSRNPLALSNYIGTAPRVRGIVEDGGYDIVHVHTPIAAFVSRFALRRAAGAHRPVVLYTAHGFHFYEGQGRLPHALYRTAERAAARWTDYLVTINDEDYTAAQALGTIDPSRVRLIPGIGVDLRLFDPPPSTDTLASTRRGLGVPDGAFMLTMVAELAPVKRHEHLLRALARVKDERVVLVLVGEGPLHAALRRLAERLGVSDRVRWAGYRTDVPAVLAASDAAVLVSEREGLARSVLEAMAAGKPVIGTQTRGIADAIGSDAGWVVAKDDVVGLAAAIEKASADPQECARKGVLARTRVRDRFALTSIIADYEELYREALASRV